MEQDTTSFWNSIKRFEDVLAKDPTSYCFAQLAELYRGLGLIDDAITTARRGHEIHPEFVDGTFALARACFDKGLADESTAFMAQVVRATPENRTALKLLVRQYLESGELGEAENYLRVNLFFHPEDQESTELLDTLRKTARREQSAQAPNDGTLPVSAPAAAAKDPFEEELFEEIFLLEEGDIIEEAADEEPFSFGETSPAAEGMAEEEAVGAEWDLPSAESKDPLTTGTLAELYVAQGFADRALSIYRELLVGDPGNSALTARIEELEALAAPEESSSPAATEPPEALPADVAEPLFTAATAGAFPEHKENVQETLEGWLENIRRRR